MLLRRLLGSLLVVLSIPVLLEGALRARHWLKYRSTGTDVFEFVTDPKTQLRVSKPGFRSPRVSINAAGFRGPEIEMPKPSKRIRIAFLGGSTTYCAEVSNNERTWPHLTVEALKKQFPQSEFDYINAGIPGYTTEQMLIALKGRVEAYQPDVVVCYEATNDLSSDSRDLAEKKGLRQAGRGEHLSRLAGYSMLWSIVELNYRIAARQKEAASGVDRLQFDPAELSHPFQTRLRALTEEAKNQNRLVALVTFSPRMRRSQSPAEQLRAANTSLFYMPYMSIQGLLSGFEEYNRVIRQTASEMNVILIGEEESIPSDETNYNDSVHFKDAGAERMAERVTRGLSAAESFQHLVHSRMSSAAN